MEHAMPSATEVRALLQPLTRGALVRLGECSGVPFHTLVKIRSGETKNPGIDTVRAFLPHVEAVVSGSASAPAPLA